MERKPQDKKQNKTSLKLDVSILALLLCICFLILAGAGCSKKLPQGESVTSSEQTDVESENATDDLNDTATDTQQTQQAQNHEVVTEADKQSGNTATRSQKEVTSSVEFEKEIVTDLNDTAAETQQAPQAQNHEAVTEADKKSGDTTIVSQEEAVTLPELEVDELDSVIDLGDIDAETHQAQNNETVQDADSQSSGNDSVEEQTGENDNSAANQDSEESTEAEEIYTHGSYELPEISLDD